MLNPTNPAPSLCSPRDLDLDFDATRTSVRYITTSFSQSYELLYWKFVCGRNNLCGGSMVRLSHFVIHFNIWESVGTQAQAQARARVCK
jgi:hypothetical protein